MAARVPAKSEWPPVGSGYFESAGWLVGVTTDPGILLVAVAGRSVGGCMGGFPALSNYPTVTTTLMTKVWMGLGG